MKKFLALFLCIILVIPAVSCSQKSSDPYEEIISEYINLIIKKLNGDTLTLTNRLYSDIKEDVLRIVDSCEEPSSMGYATKDINRDGIDELVLLDKGSGIYALITKHNNEPVLLLSDFFGYSIAVQNDGTVYFSQYEKDKGQRSGIVQIIDDKLVGNEWGWVADAEGEGRSAYKIINGVRSEITAEEMLRSTDAISSTLLGARRLNKYLGLRFVPAFVGSSDDDMPSEADFSTYESVLAAYKKIVNCYSDYTREKWVNGEFDNLFSFMDNESYDAFHNIFYGGILAMPSLERYNTVYPENGCNAYGYDEYDLNGDGIKELILLNDKYEIISVFTIKDGKAVILENLYNTWIDENGLMRRAIGTGGAVSRDGEAFIYEIKNGDLSCRLGVGYKVNVYLEKEGWYKIENGLKSDISNEEGERLYAQFDILPYDYSQSEYTRNKSEIKFNPLFENASINHSQEKTYFNSYFVGGRELVVSSITGEGLEFTYKHIYKSGEFDPISNPNPDVYETEITGIAIKNGNDYEFDIDGLKGYIELGVASAWITVTESNNEFVQCRSYLFDCIK